MTNQSHTELAALLPCPFCGHDLYTRRSAYNPKAHCITEGCKGAQLPVLNLDQPDDIAAWNTRADTLESPERVHDEIAMLRAQLANARDRIERSHQILTGIYQLLDPMCVQADGKTWVFKNPNAQEVLRLLSERIRAVPDQIDITPPTAPAQALLYEHEDGRMAVNVDATGDPKWHRVGPVEVFAAPAQDAQGEHRPGCEALGGYGHGVGPCSCGSATPSPQAERVPLSESDEALMRQAAEALEAAKFVLDAAIGMHMVRLPEDADGPVVQIPEAITALRARLEPPNAS